jgi:flagellar M-ring protein FliF
MRQVLSEMSMGRRLALMAAGALILGGFIALVLWINQSEYQVLYSELKQTDASAVVNKLKEMKVPYELQGNGTIIKVPKESVYETRLALASEGLPRGAGVGFEVFNEIKIGTTEFVQKINLQRALEGELARTISSFEEVEEARVHIVMPRESLFVEDEKKPSASVVLRLRTGRSLRKSQIEGIVYLVASAVPDLTNEKITVVDARGNLLYRAEQDTKEFPGALTAAQLRYQRSVEAEIKNKVQTMLEQVVGPGRAVVRVTGDLDFTRTTSTKQVFDPDQVAVRSETRNSENTKDAGPRPAGSPDQRFNLAQRNATPPGMEEEGGSSSDRENETTNFEVSNTRTTTTGPTGVVKRLSVAVVVDGPYKETTTAEGVTTRTFNPRSAEEMRQLTELVRRASGYNEDRGDEVSVVNAPFVLPGEAGVAAAMGWQDYVSEYGRPALNLILALLFFLMVVRPLLKYLMARHKAAQEAAEAAAAARRVGPGEELPPGEEAEALEAISGPRKLTTRDMILALFQQDPEKATSVIRAWIHEV